MDLKNQRELEKLVKFCRKQGITSLKSGDFEINLATSALFPESAYKQKKAAEVAKFIETINENPLTDDQALFWSSEGIPEEREAV